MERRSRCRTSTMEPEPSTTLRRESGDQAAAPEAAQAVLTKARRNARGRPTPQARMVARGCWSSPWHGHRLRLAAGVRRQAPRAVKLGFLSFGAEFGSSRYRQFGPRNEGGYWLHPAAEDENPEIDKAHEDYADKAIDAAIRSAGV